MTSPVRQPPGWPDRLVLASSSPRRKDLLRGIGVSCAVRHPMVDETPLPGEPPREYVARLAVAKAESVFRSGETVAGADTTVDLDGEIIGKPEDLSHARQILTRLSGRAHLIHTGVAVRGPGGVSCAVETTEVVLKVIGGELLDWYLGTGESLGRAGAYGLEGPAEIFVGAVRGSISNVVGLPLPLLHELLGAQARQRPQSGGPAGRAVSGPAGQ